LGEGLGLTRDGKCFSIFREQVGGLEFIRSSKDLCDRGLYLELSAYQRNVFLDWREVRDESGLYARLASSLDGSGVPSVDSALRELALQPVLAPFRELVNAGMFRWVLDQRVVGPKGEVDSDVLDEAERKMSALAIAAKQFGGGAGDPVAVAAQMRRELQALLELPAAGARLGPRSKENKAALAYVAASFGPSASAQTELSIWGALLGWVCVRSLGLVVSAGERQEQSRAWLDEWLLGSVIGETFRALGLDESAAWAAVTAVQVLTAHPQALADMRLSDFLEDLLGDESASRFLQVNRWDEVLWFKREAFEELLRLLFAAAVVDASADTRRTSAAVTQDMLSAHSQVEQLLRAEADSQFQVAKLLAAAREIDGPEPKKRTALKAGAKPKSAAKTSKRTPARGAKPSPTSRR